MSAMSAYDRWKLRSPEDDRTPTAPPPGYVDGGEWQCIRHDLIAANLEALKDFTPEHFDELWVQLEFSVPDIEPDATWSDGLEDYYQPPARYDFRRELLRLLREAAAALVVDLEVRPTL